MQTVLRFIGGLIVLLLGLAIFFGFAGYVGLWCCYVGSIIDFINQCKAADPNATNIAIDIVLVFVVGPFVVTSGVYAGFLVSGAGLGLAISSLAD